MSKTRWNRLKKNVIGCDKCPRLLEHCQNIAEVKRKAYADEVYWGKPVPNLGSPKVGLLVVGLAPGAHGANRTGRMFTGDRSGEWLFRALHVSGFANQRSYEYRDDGLELIDSAITNICRCAPPDNKPKTEEIKLCQPYLAETFQLCDPIVLLALGSLAWKATMKQVMELDWYTPPKPRPKFGHGQQLDLGNGRWLIGSYHPSQQNTFTGRLTQPMFQSVFRSAKRLIKKSRSKK